jgi:hypothetical protein
MQHLIKSFSLIAFILFLSSTGDAMGQDAKLNLRKFEPRVRKASFKVHGQCDACRMRIESALKIEGIKKASWDIESKILHVQYIRNEFITGEYKLQQLVAAAGHDTHKVPAAEEVYRSLPACCRYERGTPN